ncbi:MAG: hypothetical protein DMG37_08910 [Acidobacteria bacterium]|nr:MAG: hypothetical protein DMG37_08910 [Acidobacteriota bacterium]
MRRGFVGVKWLTQAQAVGLRAASIIRRSSKRDMEALVVRVVLSIGGSKKLQNTAQTLLAKRLTPASLGKDARMGENVTKCCGSPASFSGRKPIENSGVKKYLLQNEDSS